jgi:hypothetical protein
LEESPTSRRLQKNAPTVNRCDLEGVLPVGTNILGKKAVDQVIVARNFEARSDVSLEECLTGSSSRINSVGSEIIVN